MTDTENIWGEPEQDHPQDTTDEDKPRTRRELRTIEKLEEEVSELRQQLAETQAELTNLRNRKRKDLDIQYEAGRGEVISNLVQVLDSIAGAKEHGDLTDDNPLTPVLKSLAYTLESLGMGAVGEPGEHFDPNVHEALHVEYSADAEEGTTIKEVHQRGYATQERLLRPALVTVVKKK